MVKPLQVFIGFVLAMSSIFALAYLVRDYIYPSFRQSSLSLWFATGSFLYILLGSMLAMGIIVFMIRIFYKRPF
jgi:cell division protein FtsX